jgi:hypothetical protein
MRACGLAAQVAGTEGQPGLPGVLHRAARRACRTEHARQPGSLANFLKRSNVASNTLHALAQAPGCTAHALAFAPHLGGRSATLAVQGEHAHAAAPVMHVDYRGHTW